MLDPTRINVCAVRNEPSPEDVVRRVLASDHGYYERLARRRVDSPADAADIVQSFALKALERAGQLRDPAAVRGWLRRIFETSVIDHFRAKARLRQREGLFEDVHGAEAEVSSQSHSPEELPMLQAAMARLKSEYAEVICRANLQNQATAQIASDLGITTNNLSVRLHRARAAFRAALDRRLLPRAHARSVPHCSAHANCRQPRCPGVMMDCRSSAS